MFDQATAEVGNLILQKDAVDLYTDSMQNSLKNTEYLKEADLMTIHQRFKNEAIEQVGHEFR